MQPWKIKAILWVLGGLLIIFLTPGIIRQYAPKDKLPKYEPKPLEYTRSGFIPGESYFCSDRRKSIDKIAKAADYPIKRYSFLTDGRKRIYCAFLY